MTSEDWPELRLGDLVDERGISYGIVQPGSDCAGGVPIVRVNNLREGRVVTDDVKRVSPDIESKYGRTRLRGGEVLVSLVGSLGQTAIAPPTLQGWNVARAVAVVPVREDIGADWVAYVLRSPTLQHRMRTRATTTVQATLNLQDVRELPIPLPDRLERDRVTSALRALDDKIELNRRMNRTLESIARAIFKSWFVDFDPVRKTMEGGEAGPPLALSALFPCSFEGSELGEIPKGWEMGTLADVTTLNPESRTKATRSTLINYVDLSNTKWGRIESVTTYAGDDAPSRAQRVLRSGDTIVGTVRPGNGSYALVSDDGLTGSTGFAVLRPTNTVYAQYVYLAATAVEKIEALSRLADGGAYPAVRPEAVAATAIIRPSNGVLAAFSRVAGPLLGKLARNERQSRNLATLRDALLPKLISGELLVSPAKRVIPEVDA